MDIKGQFIIRASAYRCRHCSRNEKQAAEGGVSESWDPLLKQLVENRLFDGTPNRSFVWPESTKGGARLLIWLGRPEGILTSEQLRLLAAQAVKAAGRSGVRSAAIQIPNTMVNFTAEQNPQDAAQALTEGLSSEAIGNRIISVMLPSQRI